MSRTMLNVDFDPLSTAAHRRRFAFSNESSETKNARMNSFGVIFGGWLSNNGQTSTAARVMYGRVWMLRSHLDTVMQTIGFFLSRCVRFRLRTCGVASRCWVILELCPDISKRWQANWTERFFSTGATIVYIIFSHGCKLSSQQLLARVPMRRTRVHRGAYIKAPWTCTILYLKV